MRVKRSSSLLQKPRSFISKRIIYHSLMNTELKLNFTEKRKELWEEFKDSFQGEGVQGPVEVQKELGHCLGYQAALAPEAL